MVADNNIERRIRRKLSKYGLKLHKLRGKEGYEITSGEDDTEPKFYSNLYKLQSAVEAMEEKKA